MNKRSNKKHLILAVSVFLFVIAIVFSSQTSYAKERVGIYFDSSVYPGEDGKYTVFANNSLIPFLKIHSGGSRDMGQYTISGINNVQFIPVVENHFPTQDDLKFWAHKFGFTKIIVLNLHGTDTERVPVLSSQSYSVNLDIVSYNCSTGNIIYQNSYSGNVNSYPSWDANQIAEVCQNLFKQFNDSTLLFIQGNTVK